jgi:hypothetical protein
LIFISILISILAFILILHQPHFRIISTIPTKQQRAVGAFINETVGILKTNLASIIEIQCIKTRMPALKLSQQLQFRVRFIQVVNSPQQEIWALSSSYSTRIVMITIAWASISVVVDCTTSIAKSSPTLASVEVRKQLLLEIINKIHVRHVIATIFFRVSIHIGSWAFGMYGGMTDQFSQLQYDTRDIVSSDFSLAGSLFSAWPHLQDKVSQRVQHPDTVCT